MADKTKILAGRKAVDAYRISHSKLYEGGWHKGIPEEHTPLLGIMRKVLQEQGFWYLQDFFDTSELLNIQELGFKDRADFDARAPDTDREALDRMWH